jgi:nucleoside-diphosphate-sugar epimerase
MPTILVTGGAGYVGSVLVKTLLENGNDVICLDRFFFGEEVFSDLHGNSRLRLVKDDIRWFDPCILKNVDIVMDLAAMSNDPAGELDPSKTFDINFLGRSRVARLSKEYGVRRYILASSCSLYGFQDGISNESTPLNPLTTYAKANMKAEEDVIPLSSQRFCVTVLRFATVYGFSRRMRFDLAINAMVLSLYKNNRIPLMRDGQQWRPFVHIKDVASAYDLVLKHTEDGVNGKVFNVGSNDQNYQIKNLSELIAESVGKESYQIDWYGSPDFRSYKISFDKIKRDLSFEIKYSPRDGANEIYKALSTGDLLDTMKTRTVEWYKYLIECQEVSQSVSFRGTII